MFIINSAVFGDSSSKQLNEKLKKQEEELEEQEEKLKKQKEELNEREEKLKDSLYVEKLRLKYLDQKIQEERVEAMLQEQLNNIEMKRDILSVLPFDCVGPAVKFMESQVEFIRYCKLNYVSDSLIRKVIKSIKIFSNNSIDKKSITYNELMTIDYIQYIQSYNYIKRAEELILSQIEFIRSCRSSILSSNIDINKFIESININSFNIVDEELNRSRNR